MRAEQYARKHRLSPTMKRAKKAHEENPALPPPVTNTQIVRKKQDESRAILPESKKARAQQILAEMLTKKSKYVVQKVLAKALDDNDKDQMECLKIVMDRILPKDYMAKSTGKGNSINIQIMGVESAVTIEPEEEYIDGEFDDHITS